MKVGKRKIESQQDEMKTDMDTNREEITKISRERLNEGKHERRIQENENDHRKY